MQRPALLCVCARKYFFLFCLRVVLVLSTSKQSDEAFHFFSAELWKLVVFQLMEAKCKLRQFVCIHAPSFQTIDDAPCNLCVSIFLLILWSSHFTFARVQFVCKVQNSIRFYLNGHRWAGTFFLSPSVLFVFFQSQHVQSIDFIFNFNWTNSLIRGKHVFLTWLTDLQSFKLRAPIIG